MQNFTFNTLDIFLMLPIAYAAYQGYKKGFTLELVSTAGFILGLVGAIKFLDTFVQLAAPMVQQNLRIALPIVGFMTLFAMIWAISRIVGKWISKLVNHTFFGTADRAIGASVGLLKIMFVFGTLLWMVNLVGVEVPLKYTQGSMLYPVLNVMGPKTLNVAGQFVPFLSEFMENVKAALA